MKWIVWVICACLFICLPATAEVDISGLSYDELVELKDQINVAIWNSQEWQEVTVPIGIYEVGVDIPAGHWTIGATEGYYTYLRWGKALDEYGMVKKLIDNGIITSPTRTTYNENEDSASMSLKLTDGTYLEIENGAAVFTPYAGKPSFGFK